MLKPSEARLLSRQLEKLHRTETKYLRYKPSREDVFGIAKFKDKIPAKVTSTLEGAFEKGFFYIFDKGTPLIEKSGNLAEIREKAADNYALLDRGITQDHLHNFDVSAGNKAWANKGITTIEGAALGIFGIGLPAIPVFLGVIFKTIYEVAASYGFDYKTPEERTYILALIRMAAAKDADKILASRECDRLGEKLDQGSLELKALDPELIRETSNRLATSTLVGKFVQGITLVGSLGAAFNYYWIHRISKIARMKYKKRFLMRLYQGK